MLRYLNIPGDDTEVKGNITLGREADMTVANVEMTAAWDGAEGRHWAAHAGKYEAASIRHWEALLHSVDIAADDVILDIGCGTGRSTRDLARMAASGSVLGVDLSSSMLERARRSADAEGLTNVRFEQVDAQVHPFAADRFDVAVSSFGAMFFADPVAAFTNVGRALGEDGRLAMLAWRQLADNEWVTALRGALALGSAIPDPVPGVPGPFGLADREHTEQLLGDAGFTDISFEQVDEPIRWGSDTEDAFSFVSTMGMTRGLTEDLDASSRATALEALRRRLAEHETDDGIMFAGSSWLITARWWRGQPRARRDSSP